MISFLSFHIIKKAQNAAKKRWWYWGSDGVLWILAISFGTGKMDFSGDNFPPLTVRG
jgi:hypothetical protein